MFRGRSKSKKRFPHLASYVRDVTEKRITRLQVISNLIGVGIVALTAPIFGVVTGFATQSFGSGLIGALIAMPLSVFAWYLVDKRIRRPKTDEEAKRMESWKWSAEFWKLEQQRKLYKQLDPTMSQLMEAAAYHYDRIKNATSGPFWASENLPGHWRSVREQALAAADQAMEELVILSSTCMGEPETDRSKAFKEVVEDFVELDWIEAIGSLKEIRDSDWTKYAHHSPNTKHAFEPARNIAERLKRLADEIESKSEEVVKESGVQIPVESAVSSIDVVLSEISSVSEAEEELQQRTKS